MEKEPLTELIAMDAPQLKRKLDANEAMRLPWNRPLMQ